MTKTKLMERFNSRKDKCCECGCLLTASTCLGQFFVMDYDGNFYCTECEDKFEDGDERIFEPELCEEGKICEARELLARSLEMLYILGYDSGLTNTTIETLTTDIKQFLEDTK